ncbi:MAG: zinc ribbon domain-containing protein [Victivallaceae bacterium]|nr:zinc ribbon domain-containing protein [Victivallaceae bacterium]
MAELICEKCGEINHNGTTFCRKCGGKLYFKETKRVTKLHKAGKRILRKIFIISTVLLLITGIAAVSIITYLIFSTSGFAEIKPEGNEIVTAQEVNEYIHSESRLSLLMTEGSLSFLCNQMLKKSIADDKEALAANRRIEVRSDQKKQLVSVVLYDIVQKELHIRCEIGWKIGPEKPELKYIRLGKLFLPGLLHSPVLSFFESRVLVSPENKLLVRRIEKIVPAANDTLRIYLNDPRKLD